MMAGIVMKTAGLGPTLVVASIQPLPSQQSSQTLHHIARGNTTTRHMPSTTTRTKASASEDLLLRQLIIHSTAKEEPGIRRITINRTRYTQEATTETGIIRMIKDIREVVTVTMCSLLPGFSSRPTRGRVNSSR